MNWARGTIYNLDNKARFRYPRYTLSVLKPCPVPQTLVSRYNVLSVPSYFTRGDKSHTLQLRYDIAIYCHIMVRVSKLKHVGTKTKTVPPQLNFLTAHNSEDSTFLVGM